MTDPLKTLLLSGEALKDAKRQDAAIRRAQFLKPRRRTGAKRLEFQYGTTIVRATIWDADSPDTEEAIRLAIAHAIADFFEGSAP